MRRVLVDHARRHRAGKRGADLTVSLDVAPDVEIAEPIDLLRLHDALTDLAREAALPARVVELRYFGGLSIEEAAEVLKSSPATVKRHWAFARAWLFRAMSAS
jgi:RNA polymerase sigma factor (TIGR02999 family)